MFNDIAGALNGPFWQLTVATIGLAMLTLWFALVTLLLIIACRAPNKSRVKSLLRPGALGTICFLSLSGVSLWIKFVILYFPDIGGSLLVLFYVLCHPRWQ
jgi:O-antigen/teichoic acid export membrane protein